MRLKNIGNEKLREYTENLQHYVAENFDCIKTLYLNLGVKTVRLLIYSSEFIPHIKKQLSFCLRESAEKYDATIVLWKEPDVKHVYKKIAKEYDPKTNLKRRVELLAMKKDSADDFWVFEDSYSKINPVVQVSFYNNIVNLIDIENNTYYYGVGNLEPEEFIKEGHIFVQNINKILKTSDTNLVHGAVIGCDSKGVLFCARGQRGKSTLSVLSMIRGFEYVSDDYLTLEKNGDALFSYPIYSIITLSPQMYNTLYDELKECRFVSNNARKDKYVFNIGNFHKRFRTKYPVELCIFPEIVQYNTPSIAPCTVEEKGRAMVQLIHSTTMQMQDMADTKTVKKLFDMVKDFEFYKFNLCADIEENTRFLHKFLKTYNPKKQPCEFPEFIEDVTFDISNIINTKTFAIYAMNRFGTWVYQNLQAGVSKEYILEELYKINNISDKINEWIDNLLKNILKENLLDCYVPDAAKRCIINQRVVDFIKEENYYPWIAKFYRNECNDLTYKEYENGQL